MKGKKVTINVKAPPRPARQLVVKQPQPQPRILHFDNGCWEVWELNNVNASARFGGIIGRSPDLGQAIAWLQG